MNANEVKIRESELAKFETAATLTVEILILTKEIKTEIDLAAQCTERQNLCGYRTHRDKATRAYKECYVLREKLREEIEKIKEEKEEK